MKTGFRRIHLIWAAVLGIALICISFGSAAHIIAQVARWQEREVLLSPNRKMTMPGVSPANWGLFGQGIPRLRHL
jgi:hypothetical protein